MAEFRLLRRPNVLRFYLTDLQRLIYTETFPLSTEAFPRPSAPRLFQSLQGIPGEPSLRTRRLPGSFHRPRRPQTQQTRFQSNKNSENGRPQPDPTPHLGSPTGKPPLSLSERLRKLSREYGWTALGVYLALSALDFPFCFLAVRLLGTERIAKWEKAIIRGFWSVVSVLFPGGEEQVRHAFRTIGDMLESVLETVGLRKPVEEQIADVKSEMKVSKGAGESPDGAVEQQEWTWGVDEARAAHHSNASLATQLALAYAIHKSFIFVRVPLTAAILPRVVRTLRGWGWNIGKRTPKSSP